MASSAFSVFTLIIARGKALFDVRVARTRMGWANVSFTSSASKRQNYATHTFVHFHREVGYGCRAAAFRLYGAFSFGVALL